MLASLLMLTHAAAGDPALPTFLSGCWEESRADGGWTEECWTSPRGGLMIGSERDGKVDTVTHWEWMRIERASDGTLTFYASPKGAPPAAFKASANDASSITFANAAHDYPQRVSYRLTAEGLDAEISLADGSRPHRWRYRRPASR